LDDQAASLESYFKQQSTIDNCPDKREMQIGGLRINMKTNLMD
jgi:hypothetical protein